MHQCVHTSTDKIHELKVEVDILRQSNYDLIKMLTQKPNTLHLIPHNSEIKTQHLIEVNDPADEAASGLKAFITVEKQIGVINIPKTSVKLEEYWQVKTGTHPQRKQKESETQSYNRTPISDTINEEARIQNTKKQMKRNVLVRGTKQLSSFMLFPSKFGYILGEQD
ncbi:hypothetical protein HHI36_016785 [Cryptolaemus montrouzieri]|uniref:Uncharacterized protein n=1 Tax=Cryptolaemus montrouzieri TaxID=559131 RepID=A0ABD2NKQ0_9CUCU